MLVYHKGRYETLTHTWPCPPKPPAVRATKPAIRQADSLPVLVVDAGELAQKAFVEFFAATLCFIGGLVIAC